MRMTATSVSNRLRILVPLSVLADAHPLYLCACPGVARPRPWPSWWLRQTEGEGFIDRRRFCCSHAPDTLRARRFPRPVGQPPV